MKTRGKRGTILVENVIFIVLNLIFLAILVLFLTSRMENAAVLEEKYAKQIALIIDSAKPGMMISLNMKDAIDKSEEERGEGKKEEVVSINDNIVTVKLRSKGGYSYSFFNNVRITNKYFNEDDLILFIGEANEDGE